MCHIFYNNLYVNFFSEYLDTPTKKKIFQTMILEVTSLVNHHPVNSIISIDIAMSESYFTTFLVQVYSLYQVIVRALSSGCPT